MLTIARLGSLAFAFMLCALAQAAPVTFTGTVLGPDGQPVAGVTVYTGDRSAPTAYRLLEATTDAAGKFTFTYDTPRPDAATTFLVLKPGLALDIQRAKPGEPLMLRLGANPVVRAIKVVTPEGQPIAGAEVWARTLTLGQSNERRSFFLGDSKQLRAVTDAAGIAQIQHLPPGAGFYVSVTAPGRADAWQQAPADANAEVAIVLPPEAVITGRVTRDGQPVKELRVFAQGQDNARPGGNAFGACQTAGDGTYRLEHLNAATYNVMLEPPEGVTAVAHERVAVAAGQTVTGRDFVLVPGALVRGIVSEEGTGKLLAGLNVAAYGPARPQSGAACQSVQTDAQGRYEFRLPAGQNMVYFQGGQGYAYSQQNRQTIELQEGETREGVNFVLKPPLRVTGIILRPDGQLAAGARVSIRDPYATPGAQGTITPDGQFDIPAVARENMPGRPLNYGVLVATDTERGLYAEVPITAENPKLVVKLQAAAYVVGTALDPNDKPVAGINFFLSQQNNGDDYRSLAQGVTDATGKVKLGPLPPGVSVHLSQGREWYDYSVGEPWWQRFEAFTLQPGETRELPVLRLNPAGRSLTIWVGDDQQHPVAGASVFARGVTQPAKTDAQGFAKLTGLPLQGKVMVLAVHPTQALCGATEANPEWPDVPGLVLKPLTALTGQLVDKEGKPLAGSQVHVFQWRLQEALMGSYGPQPRQGLPGEPPLNLQATTDAQGRFRLAGLVAGLEYDLSVMDPQRGYGRTVQKVTPTGEAQQDLGAVKWEPEAPPPGVQRIVIPAPPPPPPRP